jgi:N-acetylmuramoyl-L-alanine amidase
VNKPLIILDPGHGAINPATGKYVTPGKASRHEVDGSFYFEGVGNRVFAKVWKDILCTYGYEVEFTVSPDDWEDMPLHERTARANKLARRKDAVLISIHSNAARSSRARGHEAFTYFGFTQSDVITEKWLTNFNKKFPDIPLRSDRTDGDLDKEANFAVVRETNFPAVLIELLFHTNDDDVLMLRDCQFQKETGVLLAESLYQYTCHF